MFRNIKKMERITRSKVIVNVDGQRLTYRRETTPERNGMNSYTLNTNIYAF